MAALIALALATLAYAQCAVQRIELKPDANYSVYLPPGRHYASWNVNGTALVLDGSGRAVVALLGRGDGFLSSAGASYILRSEGPGLIEVLSCAGFPRVIKAGGGSAAPVGLADYGLLYANGDWLPYFYRTDGVLGCFSLSGVDAVSYAPLGPAQAFSIQLNAYVEAGGGLYWVQAIVQYYRGAFNFLDNVWNVTTSTSRLAGLVGGGAVTEYGRDQYYFYTAGLPALSSGCLGISVDQRGGAAVVEFSLNGTALDRVLLPADGRPRIVVMPALNARGLPIDLELVVGGYDASAPTAELRGGSILLKLYVNRSGLKAPTAAWSLGSSTKEAAGAAASPLEEAGAVVAPGAPTLRELWAHPPCVYYMNGSRFCGSPEYLVVLRLPNGTSAFWARGGSRLSLELPTIYMGPIRYIPADKAVELAVEGPVYAAPEYVAQYLVRVAWLWGTRELWVDAGARLNASEFSAEADGVRYIPAFLAGGGESGEAYVSSPMNLSVAYTAVFSGRARDLMGLPDPLSIAVLECGAERAYGVAGAFGEFDAALKTAQPCRAELYAPPASPYLAAAAVAALYAVRLKRKSIRERDLY